MKELAEAIYNLLRVDKPLTAAGACHLLDRTGEWQPTPNLDEATQCLDWMVRNGFATVTEGGPFGPEYLKVEPPAPYPLPPTPDQILDGALGL